MIKKNEFSYVSRTIIIAIGEKDEPPCQYKKTVKKFFIRSKV